MAKDRDVDAEADGRAWREADLPELTAQHERDLAQAGFETGKLRHLAARDRYGRSLAVSVLVCFTDAYPQAASVQDVSRAGEASRLITSNSADRFEAALELRGLHGRSAAPGGAAVRREKVLITATPATGVRCWFGWALVALVAVALTGGLAAVDLGVGVVFGAIWMITAWFTVIRRLVFRRAPVGKAVGRIYAVAAICFVLAGVGASNAVLFGLGQQGVGSVDSQWSGTGTHNTSYVQCSVRQPDGSYDDVRSTGACPGPDGSPVTMVYLPGGDDQPFRPAIGTRGSLAPLAALWGFGTLAGCGLLAGAALRGRRKAPVS